MSASDAHKAFRIRKKVKNKKPINKAEREFLVAWEKRRSSRGAKPPSVDIPAPELCEETPAHVEAQADAPSSAASGPPPLNVELGDAPTGTAAAPAGSAPAGNRPASSAEKPADKKPEKKPHQKTIVGEHVRELYLKGMLAWGEKLREKGQVPLPDEIVRLGAISAQWLADEHLGPVFGESELIHWLNAGTPVAWCWWFGRKGAKKPVIDQEEPELRTIDDVAAKHAGPIPPTIVPPAPPPTVTEIVTGSHQQREQETIKKAIGIGGSNDPAA